MENILLNIFIKKRQLGLLTAPNSKLVFSGKLKFIYRNSVYFRNVFTVKNIEDAPEGSDQLLEDLIDYFIEKADKSTGTKAEKCSIIIRSAVLEKPIQIPYRGFAQNTPQVVMEQLDSVDQSGKRMGRPSLYSQPIHIEVYLYKSKKICFYQDCYGTFSRRGSSLDRERK